MRNASGAVSRPYRGARAPVPGLAFAGSGQNSSCFLGHSAPYPRDPRVPQSSATHGRMRRGRGIGGPTSPGSLRSLFPATSSASLRSRSTQQEVRSLARGRERSSRQRAWCGAERSTTAFQAIELTPGMTDPAHCAQKRCLPTF